MLNLEQLREDFDLRKSEIKEIKEFLDKIPDSNKLSNSNFDNFERWEFIDEETGEFYISRIYFEVCHPELMKLIKQHNEYSLHIWEHEEDGLCCELVDIDWEEGPNNLQEIVDYFKTNLTFLGDCIIENETGEYIHI